MASNSAQSDVNKATGSLKSAAGDINKAGNNLGAEVTKQANDALTYTKNLAKDAQVKGDAAIREHGTGGQDPKAMASNYLEGGRKNLANAGETADQVARDAKASADKAVSDATGSGKGVIETAKDYIAGGQKNVGNVVHAAMDATEGVIAQVQAVGNTVQEQASKLLGKADTAATDATKSAEAAAGDAKAHAQATANDLKQK